MRDLSITRRREDATRDNWGSYLLLRDEDSGAVWSATWHPPLGAASQDLVVNFNAGRAEFVRFTRQISHLWIDFRGIQDAFMREKVSTTSKTPAARPMRSNNTRPTLRSSLQGMAKTAGGSPASDGPGPDTIKVNGIERQFFDYLGRRSTA